MSTEQMKVWFEIGIMVILAVSLLTILVLYISKNSSINMLCTQIDGFKNKTELEIQLNKIMSFFYSLVSNAVYIGLFGTVIGVMITLQNMDDRISQKVLISSLSLPLMSTAVSIVVAIIGTFCYHAIVAKIDETLRYWDIQHGYAQKSC